QTQNVSLPLVVPTGVTRETGTLGILAEKQLSVTAGAAQGLSQVDAGQFAAPAAIAPPGAPATAAPASALLLAYRFAARPVPLQLLVARQKPQSKCIAEHAVIIG